MIFLLLKKLIVTMVVLSLLIGLVPSMDSILLQHITDSIESYSDQDLASVDLPSILFKWVIIYAVWWEALNSLWRLYDYLYLKVMPKIKASVIDDFYDYVQHHSHEFFQTNLAGDITNKISEASRSIEMVFAYTNETVIRKISVLVFALITLYSVHYVLALIFLCWFIVFLTISLFSVKRISRYSTVFSSDKALVSGKIVDAISNSSVIRMFSSQRGERKYLKKYINNTVRSDQALQWFMFKLRYVLGFSCTVMIGFMIYYIIELRGAQEITIGQCLLTITLCLSVINDIWDLTQEFGNLFEQIGSFNQSISLFSEHTIKNKPDAKKLIVESPSIEFKNVTFRYRSGENSFENKSIIIPARQKVGLAGFSGSGKSTFTNMISRLYEIENGNIYIDGQNITDVTLHSLHKNISIIPQEPILFHRTIRQNILYGDPNASEEEMFAAARSAYIHDFIMGLPDQYDTMCGERGNNFSGGQRQRISIARAFMKKAPILILDEATNSLDSYTEQLIQESLKELMIGKTVLVIAHRLSTLVHMDRILVFANGHIIEDGSHKVLHKDGVMYKMLWDNY